MARPSILGVKTEDSGVYLIKNIVNGKVYVGSAKRLIERVSLHKHLLKNDKHHSIHLQRAWNRYGENVFIFGVLEIIKDNQDLIVVEQKYIDEYQSFNDVFGYNICPKAKNNLGSKHTKGIDEKRKRMLGNGNNFYNKKHTEDAKYRIGLNNHQRKLSDDDVNNIRIEYKTTDIKQSVLAKKYNIHPSHISDIINNKKRKKKKLWLAQKEKN